MEIKPTNLILRAMICLLTSFETAQSFEARAQAGHARLRMRCALLRKRFID
jgi:hypothetical protein